MATQFAVDLVFKSQTKSLNDIQRKLQQLEANLNKLNKGQPFKPIEDGAGRAGVKVNGLVKTLGKLALAYGALRAGQAAISAGIDRIESERRIQFLAQSYGEAAQLAQAAANAARKFGVSQTEANEALATTYARLRPVGVSLQEIEGIYAGFSTAARISGASATEAEGAFRQLAQGLGSGALRGDEFNSVAEQVPLILTAVSKETGIAQGKLRDYAAEGKITSDVVIRALKRIEKEGADQLEAALDGPQQKIKDFQTASEDLAVAFSRELIPEMTGAISELAQTLRDLIPILKAIGRVAAAVFKYIGGLARRINDMMNGARMAQAELQADAQAQKQTREKYGILGALTKEAQDYRAAVKAAQLAAARDAMNPIPGLSAAGAPDFGGALPSVNGGGGSKGGSASKEAEKLAEKLQESLKAGQELSREFSRQIELRRAGSDLERELLEIKYEFQDRQERINELLDESQKSSLTLLNTELQRLDTLKAITGEMQRYWESQVGAENAGATPEFGLDENELEKWIGDSEQKLKELLDPINQIKMGATLIGESFATAFGEVAKGTKTAQEAFSDMLKKMGDALIDYATTAIAQYIAIGIAKMFAGMLTAGSSGMNSVGDALSKNPLSSGKMFPSGVFAEGGYVTGPTNALIGEAGEAEYVIPASKMGSAMSRYQAGQRGGSVVNGPGGGGAGGGGGGNNTFTLETVVINNVEYATVAQVREMGAAAAKRGAEGGYTKTMSSMRNSRSTRARLGMG